MHFAEAGPVDAGAKADIALVEGSVSTPEEQRRIREIREATGTLVAIGACAASGGLQALRNGADADAWKAAVYAHPEHIDTLATATPVSEHVRVDFEIRGCPVNSRQVTTALRDLLSGFTPRPNREKVCTSCKHKGVPCVTVARGEPCLGPVTSDGCGALCPALGRGCYGCYGPAPTLNAGALVRRMGDLGLPGDAIARRFAQINSQAPGFAGAAKAAKHE